MLQVESLLFGVVVGEDVLALTIGMISAPVLVLVVEDGGCYGAGADGSRIGAIYGVGVGRITMVNL